MIRGADISKQKQELFSQLDGFYSRPATGGAELEAELLSLTDKYEDPYKKREVSYTFLSQTMAIEVFCKCPFAFEINDRSSRSDVEASGISYWYSRLPKARAVLEEFNKNIAGAYESGLAIYYLPVDNGHLTIDYHTVLKKGLAGIKEDIAHFKASAPQCAGLYSAMESGLDGYVTLGRRFSQRALGAAEQCEGKDRERMLTLADVMSRVPEHPAGSFIEALCAIVFMYYAVPALDGGNVSVLGHVDLLLGEYLDADLKKGAITLEEAFDYIWRFLYIPDCRFGLDHKGTNCTVTLGGCDGDGVPVFNEVTRLILKAYMLLGCMDPKLNLRLSPKSPKELWELAALAVSKGNNNICIFNDEVIIGANCKAGKRIQDARLYVAGGCQENVIAGCEQSSRATIYMNALVSLVGLWDDRWDKFALTFCNQAPERLEQSDGFDDVYAKTMRNLKIHITAQVNMKNISEKKGADWCLSPAHSALLGDCIKNGKDMYSGGTRYSSGSVSLAGIATLLDSLLAIRWAVFDEGLISLSELAEAVKNNFKGRSELRDAIIRHAPKLGRDKEASAFARRFFLGVAALSEGLKNTRGGKYEASLFSFRSFTALGCNFPATPDGRLEGEYLSASASPSLLAEAHATAVISSVKDIDFTDYPVVAVSDVKIPNIGKENVEALMRVFIKNGGSVLQFNVVDQQTLMDAKAHPELYPDLVVRVSGFSARFVCLTPQEQDEVIQRIYG